MKQLLLDFSPDFVPTLENFVAGRNAELLHTLRELAAGAGAERFVYMWGEPGSGRSHLLKGVVEAARRRGLAARYVAPAEVSPELADHDLLALDDVACLDEGAQIALFDLYNRLREGGGRLLASGPQPPQRLPLRPDVVTRLAWGLVFQAHALSDGEKMEALESHARGRGFALPREAAGYLMRHWRRDLPSLLAALDALDRYSLEAKRPVTVPLLREILRRGGA